MHEFVGCEAGALVVRSGFGAVCMMQDGACVEGADDTQSGAISCGSQ